jgi:hypothetical protein
MCEKRLTRISRFGKEKTMGRRSRVARHKTSVSEGSIAENVCFFAGHFVMRSFVFNNISASIFIFNIFSRASPSRDRSTDPLPFCGTLTPTARSDIDSLRSAKKEIKSGPNFLPLGNGVSD